MKPHFRPSAARPIALVATEATSANSTEEMEKTVAFRLSEKERVALKRATKRGTSCSLALRSMLITHLLLGHDRITSATFQGGYRVCQAGRSTWKVVHNGSVLYRSMERDDALLRGEWIAQGAVQRHSTARASKLVAFRLSLEEHAALTRLSAANDLTSSAALRSFLTTRLVKHKQGLLEVHFCNGYLARPDHLGWTVSAGRRVIAERLSREDALRRADWLSQAGRAAAS